MNVIHCPFYIFHIKFQYLPQLSTFYSDTVFTLYFGRVHKGNMSKTCNEINCKDLSPDCSVLDLLKFQFPLIQ